MDIRQNVHLESVKIQKPMSLRFLNRQQFLESSQNKTDREKRKYRKIKKYSNLILLKYRNVKSLRKDSEVFYSDIFRQTYWNCYFANKKTSLIAKSPNT